MIQTIFYKNFKGAADQVFRFEDQPHAFLSGPNGSGKSRVTDALILCLNGEHAGAGKKNQNIYAALGMGGVMEVSVTISDVLFTRRYRKTGDSVSCELCVDGKKVKGAEFNQALGDAGAPAIIDVRAMMKQSSEKLSSDLMRTYPPETDIRVLDKKLAAAKAKINSLNAEKHNLKKANTTLIEKVAERRKNVTGTVGSIDAEIDEVDKQRDQLLLEIHDEKERLRKEHEKEGEPIVPDSGRVVGSGHVIRPSGRSTPDPKAGPVREAANDLVSQAMQAMDPIGIRPQVVQELNELISAMEGCPRCTGESPCVALMLAKKIRNQWR